MLDSLFVASVAAKMTADNRARTSAEMASRLANEVRTQNEKLQYDVEKLYLITQALWEILKQHHDYSDDQLEAMITNIDMRDGRLDGKLKVTKEPQKCSQCSRTIIVRQSKCLYCGVMVENKSLRG